MRAIYQLLAILAIAGVAPPAFPDILPVAPGESIQAAIAAATPGDTVAVAAGTFNENLNFLGKAVTVLGVGPDTIIQGTGSGPVVTFNANEPAESILDSVTITGGSAMRGGGVYIRNSRPTIVRTVITQNQASQQGSGIYIEGNSPARLYNNLIIYNRHNGGDPHGVQIVGASPIFVNNTIARSDSNGMLISGAAFPIIMNNIIALNGSSVLGDVRGRGICDFSNDQAFIAYNDFFSNRIAALLRNGQDWRRVRTLQQESGDPNIIENLDGSPAFRRPISRNPDVAAYEDFFLKARGRQRARDRGNPDPACNDLDDSRNDMGFTGGPYAPGSTAIPHASSCGAS